MTRTFLPLLLATVLAASSFAQHHHEEPAKPVTAEMNLGEVTFPNSGSAEAQAPFLRGVLLLHSFEYTAAERAFAEARKIDPSFAMAYWGEAMTHNHPIWGEQDRAAARAILAQIPAAAPRTAREKAYLGALDLLYGEGDKKTRDAKYSAAMEVVAADHPDDLDARAFHALSLLGLTGQERDLRNYMRAAAIAEEVYQRNPRHPGAIHYLIHAYDDPVHAPLGLRAARLYAKVAPAASHAQHMPSHIFFALGMWDEANVSNIDSMKTARDQGMGGYHPLHWLEHGYLQINHDDEAAKLVKIVEDDVAKKATATARMHLAMTRATWLVETRGRGPASLLQKMLERVDASGITAIMPFAGHDFARGLAAVEQKNLALAREARRDLGRHLEAGRAALAQSGEVVSRSQSVSETDVRSVEVMALALDAAIAFAGGNREEAVRLARKAAESEDALIFEYGPPATVKPAWELTGEMLLAMDRKSEATDAFRRVQQRYPNRRLTVLGLEHAKPR